MTTPHKHAALIKQWADGAQIQYKDRKGSWHDCNPAWDESAEYRVKPVDIVKEFKAVIEDDRFLFYRDVAFASPANLRLTFDAKTGALKSAEVIK